MANMSAEELARYVTRYNGNVKETYEDNLEKISIIDMANPSTISFCAS